MRTLQVYCHGILAGMLTEMSDGSFTFSYNDIYFSDSSKPAVSLTFPKKQKEYSSQYLFPFFSNMVAEGTNLSIQSKYLNIDENDVFSLLAATATSDTIGAVTVKING